MKSMGGTEGTGEGDVAARNRKASLAASRTSRRMTKVASTTATRANAFQYEHHLVRGETRACANKYKYRASQRWEILAHVLQLHCVIYLLRQSASFSISKQLQLVRSLVELLSNMLVAADSYISIDDVAYRLDPTLKSEAR